MLQLSVDHHEPTPLVEQIVQAVRHQVDDRILRPGMRLPPIRKLAQMQDVSRFTVVEAYDRLVALGYLPSRRGSGFYVAPRSQVPDAPRAASADRAIDVAWLMRQALDESTETVKASRGVLPTEWFDQEGLRRHLRSLGRRADARVASYGSAQGYRPLRQQLQVRLAEFGIGAPPEQIVLTVGATQALDIVARHLVKPGDTVFVDDPGYYNFFGNLRLLGAQLVGVPRGHDGPDIDALDALLAEHRPKVFFTHSVLHNPTGASLSPAAAFRLLQLANKHDFVVIEDDVYADMQPGTSTRLANLDQLDRVIYIGSFSKTLSGSLRVGFIAANPDLIAELTDVKLLTALSSPEFGEQLVYQMLTDGHYRKHIERLHGRLEAARSGTLRMFDRLGMSVYHEPKGGLFLWARHAAIEESATLSTRALQSGIVLAPGKVFRPQMQGSPWLRFNVAVCTDCTRLERFLAEQFAAL